MQSLSESVPLSSLPEYIPDLGRHVQKGRPSDYDQDMADKICAAIGTSTDGLQKLIKKHGLPDNETILRWRFKYEHFDAQYTLAKKQQAQIIAESLIELCQLKTVIDDRGLEIVDSARVNLLRLQIDTIKWQASKLVPKLYGDKIQNEVTVIVRHEDALGALE